ncbi:MAG: response regulator [Nanoarchaeota archaeon]|nr:response regulator [Nanoarchaeota archaeon]
MKILIADDEIEICKRLKRELKKEGHEVEYRTSPLNVLEYLKSARRNSEPYNLLLLNIRMPEMDGLTLFSRIKEERLGVEVIIMTGYREEQIVIEAIRFSIRNYLNKPISLEELSSAISHVQKKAVEAKNDNGKYHVLVVDDEKDLCRHIKRKLEKEGYKTVVAFTGEECIDYFKKNRVDVVIADIRMPKMSGLEMLERCREINDDFILIIITGYGDHETAKKALKLDAYDYFKKPLSLDELITSVKKGIKHSNALHSTSAFKGRKNESTDC